MLVTAAQASNFSPGQTVFMESGDASPPTGHPPAHFEFNVVLSANPTTGIITLRNQLSDTYDWSNSTYPPMIAPISVVPSNITVHDLGVTTSASASSISVEGTINTLIYNCSFTALNGTTGYIWNGYSWHAVIRDSQFLGVSSDLGDAGAYFQFTNNQMQNGILFGGGSGRQWLVDNNTFKGLAISTACDCAWAIDLGGSFANSMTGLQISNNSIYLSDQVQYGGGIMVWYTDTAIVRGNTISGASTPSTNGQDGISVDSGSTNTEVSQNIITSTNLHTGVALQSGSSGTSIMHNDLSLPGYGILIFPDAVNNTVGCNNFSGNATNIKVVPTGSYIASSSCN